MGLTRNQIKCTPVIDWCPLSIKITQAMRDAADAARKTATKTAGDCPKESTMTLFEKLGMGTVNRIDTLLRKKQIIAVNHQHNGTCLVLKDASRLILEGLLQDDSERLVGYLGFYGHGPNGLGTPAFAIRPDGYPDRG